MRRGALVFRGAGPDLLRALLEAHERALGERSRVLKNEHKTAITRVELEGREYVVKHYRYTTLRRFLKGAVVTPPGRRTYRTALEMRRRGLSTPEPIGLVERRRWGLPLEAWYVCRAVEDATEMDRYLARHRAHRWGRSRRLEFLEGLAAAIEGMLEQGVLHGDLKTCNILVTEEPPAFRFHFIDLDDVEVGERVLPLEFSRWVLLLAQLNPSTPAEIGSPDRLRFLRRLRDPRRFEERRLIRAVLDLCRKRGRGYYTDSGTVERPFP